MLSKVACIKLVLVMLVLVFSNIPNAKAKFIGINYQDDGQLDWKKKCPNAKLFSKIRLGGRWLSECEDENKKTYTLHP